MQQLRYIGLQWGIGVHVGCRFNLITFTLALIASAPMTHGAFVWTSESRTLDAADWYVPNHFATSGQLPFDDVHVTASSGGTFGICNRSINGPFLASGYNVVAMQNTSFSVSGESFHLAGTGEIHGYVGSPGLFYDAYGYGFSRINATFDLTSGGAYRLSMLAGAQNGSGFLQRGSDPPIAFQSQLFRASSRWLIHTDLRGGDRARGVSVLQ